MSVAMPMPMSVVYPVLAYTRQLEVRGQVIAKSQLYPTKLAALNMVVDAIVSIALYKPLGIAGLVIGTAVANVVKASSISRAASVHRAVEV